VKFIKWLDDNIEKVMLCTFLSVMVLVMGVQVVARYVFNESLTWSEELTRYLFVWSAFISLPYTLKRGTALRIDQLITMFPNGAKKVINIVGYLLMIVFFGFMLYNSFGVVQSAINSGQKSPALGLPMYMVQVASVVSFGLAIFRAVQLTFISIKKQTN